MKYPSESVFLDDLQKHNDLERDNVGFPTLESWKKIAEREGIELEGVLPGFAATVNHSHIIYYSIREDGVINMAIKYALKEGESAKNSPLSKRRLSI